MNQQLYHDPFTRNKHQPTAREHHRYLGASDRTRPAEILIFRPQVQECPTIIGVSRFCSVFFKVVRSSVCLCVCPACDGLSDQPTTDCQSERKIKIISNRAGSLHPIPFHRILFWKQPHAYRSHPPLFFFLFCLSEHICSRIERTSAWAVTSNQRHVRASHRES